MKKLIYCAAALATAIFAGSCQRELLDPAQDGSTVTFTVNVPEVATKGFADGREVINDLVYAVYKTAATTEDAAFADYENYVPVYQVNPEKKTGFTNGSTTVELELINDQNYVILFWAQNFDADVYNTTDLLNVSYAAEKFNALKANEGAYAAFSGRAFIEKVKGSSVQSVTLYRPFAQINIGTADPEKYDVKVSKTAVSVSRAGAGFNVANQTALESATTPYVVEFNAAAMPNGEKLTVGTTEYHSCVNNEGKSEEEKLDHYVAMNYIFAKETVSVTYAIETTFGTVTNTIDNVPVKTNYRTNIIGNLLTSDVKYNVTLDDDWAGEYYGEPWVEIPPYNAETKTYTVTTDLQLLWIAQQVNSGAKTFEGETVQVAADIDLENILWSPIGTSTTVTFKGMFEGVSLTKSGETYPTISNFKIENGYKSGFFGVLCNGGKVRNLNFSNVTISGEAQLGVVVGYLYGNLNNPTIENVTVENANITAIPVKTGDVYDNGDKVGGIAGLIGQNAYIQGCTVKNSTFNAYRDMGGIVGSTQSDYASKIVDNTVKDLTFTVTSKYTPYKDNSKPGHYDAIRGGRRSNAGDVIEDNTTENEPSVYVESSNGAAYDSKNKVYSVTAPEGLAVALSGAGGPDAGNHTINIACNLDMTNVEWTPINVDGYNGADIVTVNGNGNTINGLKAALFAGGFAGGSGIVIKDLTIEGAHMIADNKQGYGAFVNCADSMDEITLINCHLKNSTIITPNDGAAESRIGGLVGWTAGYNKQNDGPVDSHITIQNCSVTGCTIKGAGSIGGICGHAGANAATYTKIENCVVTGNTLVSTDDGDWRVGAIVGTANNGQCEINNVTVSENTIQQTDKTAARWQSELYGRFVPAGTGTLKIDDIVISAETPELVNDYTALYTVGGEYCVYDLQGLKDLHDFFQTNCMTNSTWGKTYNICKDIDANGYTWDGVYLIIGDNTRNGIVIDGKGKTITNLSIKNYLLTGTANGANDGTTPGEIRNITLDRATVNGEGWFTAPFWGNLTGDITYTNVHVLNSTIKGINNVGGLLASTGEGTEYNVIFDGCSVENTVITANGADGQDPTGASGFMGRAFATTSIKFLNNNVVSGNTLTNHNGLVGGKVYGYTTLYGNGFTGTGACDTFTNWGGIATVNTADALKAALKKSQAVVLTDNITVTDAWDARNTGAKTTQPVVIDGNGHTLTLKCDIYDGGNYHAAFRFESDAIVKNLIFDMSEAINGNNSRARAISAKFNLIVENCTFIGNPNLTNTRAIIFGEGQGVLKSAAEISISGCTFTNWTRGITDNENAQDVKKVTVKNNTFNNSHAYMSAYESVTFTGNTMNNSCVNIKSYSSPESLVVTVEDNELDKTQENKF